MEGARRSSDSNGAGSLSKFPVLLGRDHERRAIDAVIEGARKGSSRTLVLRGEGGMGKSNLLRTIGTEPDLLVLSVEGLQAESNFAFASLERLLAPVIDRARHLPSSQLTALEVALGLSDGDRPDRFLVGLAVLTLLADPTDDRAVVCIVDDAQWVDIESLRVLSFVARRLEADKVGMLFATRSISRTDSPLDDLESLTIEGLQPKYAEALLSVAAGRPLSIAATERIVHETQGCPLAIIELATDFSAEELERLTLFPEPLPIGKQLETYYLSRYRSLPPETQTLLLIRAADASRDDDCVRQAATFLNVPIDADAPAIDADLLDDRGWLRFRHSLVRSAIYSGSPTAEKRRVHQALAEVTSADHMPERRAWHRAAAATCVDEEVAAELERAATLVGRRGGLAAEATFRTRSAELTPRKEDRSRRLLDAAQAAFVAGIWRQARSLLDEAADITNADSPLLEARIRRLRALLNWNDLSGDAAAIHFQTAQAIEPHDVRYARHIYLEALEAALLSGSLTRTVSPREIAARPCKHQFHRVGLT